MGTKRNSGTQHNPKGITQGNTLVCPKTGNPIDTIIDNQNVTRLAVDAAISIDNATVNVDLDYDTDGVHIGDRVSGNELRIEPDGSINANTTIDAADGDNIAINDSDGDELAINSDGSINVNILGASTPTIVNINVALANTEQSYALPANTKRFFIQARGNAKIQLAFTSSQSGTNYITISPGSKYEEKSVQLSSTTLYFQLNKAGQEVEILSWA